MKIPEFTESQIDEIRSIYSSDFLYGDKKLNDFCLKYNKLKSNVCRKARRLGLTNPSIKLCNESRENISLLTKIRLKEKGHPKGMLNKNHTEKSKIKMSGASKNMWEDLNSKVNTDEHRQILSDNMMNRQAEGKIKNQYSRSKQGHYNINGKEIFFRSLWEANYALYLDFLIKQNQISKWEFEVDNFWFEKIKRGVRSYKPDFKVFDLNNEIIYHEVKGWMDDKSKTKLKRMKLYHPEIKIKLIEKKQYDEIKKQLNGIIKFY